MRTPPAIRALNTSKMTSFLLRAFRSYIFYSSPDKLLIRRAVRSYLAQREGYANALEVGAGSAQMTEVIKRSSRIDNYIVSDYAAGNEAVLICDAQDLPFADNTFDLVTSFEVLEHIQRPHEFIEQMFRVLQPNGVAIISVPFVYGRHDFHDYHRWTKEGLETAFNTQGLKVREVCLRGGTFLSAVKLLLNYFHSVRLIRPGGWRTSGFVPKAAGLIKTLFLAPLVLLCWPALALDLLIDRDSANPCGFVLLAEKGPANPIK